MHFWESVRKIMLIHNHKDVKLDWFIQDLFYLTLLEKFKFKSRVIEKGHLVIIQIKRQAM